MMRLKKYLKPFILPILLAIGLLFVSNFSDLKLPDIMSNIVNVGIQQSGIEHAAPDAISEDGYEFMLLLMDDQQKSLLNENYQKINRNDSNYLKQYPLLSESDIYVLDTKDEAIRSQLDETMGVASWTLINAMQQMGGSSESMGDISDVDINEIYKLSPMLAMMDFTEARQTALQLDASTRQSTAIVFAQMFYEELGMEASSIQFNYLIGQGGYMLLIALIGVIAVICVGYLSSKISSGVARNLRLAVFKKVESFSNEEFDEFTTSSLITRTTNDITQIQNLVNMGLRMIISAPIMGIGALVMIFNRNTSMVWILGLAIVAVSCLILFMFIYALPKFKIIQKLIDRLNLVSRENLDGLMVVRAFRGQQFEKERFDEANANLKDTQLYINRVMSLMMPMMTIILNMISILIIWVGAHQIADAQMQVGDMMAFMQYAMQVISAFLMIAMMFIMVPRASVSASRIADVLEHENKILDPKEAVDFVASEMGVVEFDRVSFNYGDADENVLNDISFKALPGQTTAIIGSTGSGKSTLINLIPRFYDVDEGAIKVNGVDIRNVLQHDLHEQIGYVAQKGVLLSGSIASNIAYGNPKISATEIETIAGVAQATDFINSKEDKYDSLIAQGGTNVSGGQKQRLSIARALATNAPIFIFDDSFSALDFKTDAALRAALKQHTSNATIIIVAQRVSSIMNAEQIIVLDEGRIVGKGTHEQLLKSCPTYYEIASSQLTQEEL